MATQEAVDSIILRHASISRFGDGEFKLIQGGSINFQPYHHLLAERLKEVLLSEHQNMLIGIPDIFEHLDRYCLPDQRFWRQHLCWNRCRWYKLLQRNHIYVSTFISRFYSIDFNQELASQRFCNIQRIWNNRNVLIVEGQDTKMGIGNTLFDNAKFIRRILCPSKDAFSKYGEILSAITSNANCSTLIIIALGPTATVLAYDLFLQGFQSLDLGHLDLEYEWYLQGTKHKDPVVGKFSNEAYLEHRAECEIVGALESDDYKRQVICLIK